MFKNYIISAYRHLVRSKLYSGITIFGLAIGLTAVLLILTYIRSESSYDQFHAQGDRIYRLSVRTFENKQLRGDNDYVIIAAQGPALKAELPEVEDFTCTTISWQNLALRYENNEPLCIEKVRYADTSFLQFFSFELFIKVV